MDLLIEFVGELLFEPLVAAFGLFVVGIWNALRESLCESPTGAADPLVVGFIGRATRDAESGNASARDK